MYVVFKEQIIDEELVVEPLFCWENMGGNVFLDTVIKSMNDLLTEEQNIRIFSVYAGDYEFFDLPDEQNKKPVMGIAILIKIVNGMDVEILKVSENYYLIEEYAKMLNKEVTDPKVEYRALKVRGKLI